MFPKIRKKIQSTHALSAAALYLMGSTLLYALHDTFIKLLSPAIKLNQIIFYRSLMGILPILLLGFIERPRYTTYYHIFHTQFFKAHILRSIVFGLSLLFYILACRLLPLPEVYALSYSSPLFVILLSVVLLKERASWQQYMLVICGFIGVIIVLRPGYGCLHWQVFAPVLSGLFTALSIIWGRQLAFADSNSLIVMIYTLFCLILSAVTMSPMDYGISNSDLMLFLLIGVLGSAAQWGFLQAFRLAPASTLAPFDYLGLLWATVLSCIVFNQFPDAYVMGGAIIIVGTGLMNIYLANKKITTAA